MKNLIKMEVYQLSHNWLYWFSCIGVFLLGFLTADSYLSDILGSDGNKALSLFDVFNGMVYDSTFLLIILSSFLAFLFGQEFTCRTINLELCAGHEKHKIFASKLFVYLISFNFTAILFPIGGCAKEFSNFGLANGVFFFYHVIKVIFYSYLLNSAVFLAAICFCFAFRNTRKSLITTALCIFISSLYLGYGLMLDFPVWFLPTFQIREIVTNSNLFSIESILMGIIWDSILLLISWKFFKTCELK